MEHKCPVCGAPMASDQCEYCGYRKENVTPEAPMQKTAVVQPEVIIQPVQTVIATPVSQKNKMTALILCILFGVFGIHHFYVGKAGMGILYLLSLGLFGIGWVVDIFRIATGTFKDSNGLKLA